MPHSAIVHTSAVLAYVSIFKEHISLWHTETDRSGAGQSTATSILTRMWRTKRVRDQNARKQVFFIRYLSHKCKHFTDSFLGTSHVKGFNLLVVSRKKQVRLWVFKKLCLMPLCLSYCSYINMLQCCVKCHPCPVLKVPLCEETEFTGMVLYTISPHKSSL